MAYEIHIVDSTNSIQLDTDDLDIATTFSVADIKDISARKDTITKTILLKGTNTNNLAFGSMFHLNKVANSSINNKIGSNYSPLRPVDCFVYEDGMLILRGNLRVLDTPIKNGSPYYEVLITGKFIELKVAIQDKFLSDIDFTDFKHRYNFQNIRNTWQTSFEVYNSGANTFSNVTAGKGKGYVYPFIDYASKFKIDDGNASNSDLTKFNGLNFRPAVYVKEYFKRIIEQAGWTYEFKGSTEDIKCFNSLIVPAALEKMQYTYTGLKMHWSKPAPFLETESGSELTFTKQAKLLNINNFTFTSPTALTPFVTLQSSSPSYLFVGRTFTSDAIVQTSIANITNPYYIPAYFSVQFVERTASGSGSQLDGWNAIAQETFLLYPNTTIALKNFTFNIGERTYTSGTNLGIRVYIENPTYYLGGFPRQPHFTYSITQTTVDIPKTLTSLVTADVIFNDAPNYDIIQPTPPENIKQMDFIKSIMNVMNLYAYTHKSNPKHLIFESYDNYYALSNVQYLKTASLNWTNKVAMNSFKIIPNISLAKSYTFTFKDDTDWLNSDYKKKYFETFGTYNYTDAFGLVDSKKVEVIFSPTPISKPSGTERFYPLLCGLDGANTKPQKTNIRLLYYNGVKTCNPYRIMRDRFSGAWVIEELNPQITEYPQVNTFYYNDAGQAIEDLNWGRPKEYYFPATVDYVNANSLYSKYYSNQVTELTNINVSTMEVDVRLNEIDINNLDLKVPVFIDLGEFGHAYFKVLSVDYQNNNLLSKVVLQKIYAGTIS